MLLLFRQNPGFLVALPVGKNVKKAVILDEELLNLGLVGWVRGSRTSCRLIITPYWSWWDSDTPVSRL